MTPLAHNAVANSLRTHEGNVLKVYDDADGKPIVAGKLVVGVPTIGVGRNLVKGITPSESDYLFNNDRQEVENELDRFMPWWQQLNDARQVAIVELGFNLGVEHLQRAWPLTVEYVKTGRYSLAALEIRNNKVWMGEVKARGEWIAKLIETGFLT